MRALLYHDVAPEAEWLATGFQGGDAAVYKLTPDAFDEHLDALHVCGAPSLVTADAASWLLTFDDGGLSALTTIAPALERRGWRGHFFMTTGRIGTSGFLDAESLRDLVRRGHVIGSHSVTHPLAMASCSSARLAAEWADSVAALADILAVRPTVASIPGGAFGPNVAEAAGRAGIRILFTSEPTARTWRVGDVLCIGRFTIWRGMPPAAARAFASGRGFWPVRQRAVWEAKKLAKGLLGRRYLDFRKRVLDRKEPEPAMRRRADL
jgi:peptidoglycan/xylan/chitin deacetylase (PgdA/CDA1 family)